MKKFVLASLITTAAVTSMLIAPAFAQNESRVSLDDLLNKVKQEQLQDHQGNQKREQEFLAAKEKQQQLLAEAKKDLAKVEAVSRTLSQEYDRNEKQLSELETKLEIAMGTLGEMFGVVKQVAGDLKGQFEASVISSQITGRAQFMADLAQRKKLATIDELERLWFELQREMTESGKVVRYNREIVTPDGKRENRKLTRIGSFNLVGDGVYLNYEPETQQVVELARQPQGRYLSLIEDLEENTQKAMMPFAIDPSRGTILSMLVQAPSMSERLQQGGLVGYVILALLVVGVVLVIERMVVLQREKKQIMAQLESNEIDTSNPLGALRKTFEENKNQDIESLELKLDEAILKSRPKLERGIGTIKLLAAVAPLLGLLGTVTGMILTFQSITLFGTGDPKLMAGGISQALITTVLGLVCAIPMLLLHNVVAAKSKSLLQILEEQVAGMLAQRAEGKQ